MFLALSTLTEKLGCPSKKLPAGIEMVDGCQFSVQLQNSPF